MEKEIKIKRGSIDKPHSLAQLVVPAMAMVVTGICAARVEVRVGAGRSQAGGVARARGPGVSETGEGRPQPQTHRGTGARGRRVAARPIGRRGVAGRPHGGAP